FAARFRLDSRSGRAATPLLRPVRSPGRASPLEEGVQAFTSLGADPVLGNELDSALASLFKRRSRQIDDELLDRGLRLGAAGQQVRDDAVPLAGKLFDVSRHAVNQSDLQRIARVESL